MKKIFSLMLTLVLVVSLFASCTKPEPAAEKKEDKTEAKVTEAKKDEPAKEEEPKEEAPTLKWITIGSGMPDNYESWQKQVNDYIEPIIGAKVDVEVVSWGDWDTRRNLVITSGEPYDIIFGNGGTFAKDVEIGALADITELVNGSKKLTDLIAKDYWRATTIGGKVYGVPTYKDSSMTNYFVWDKGMLDKYGVENYEEINNFASAYPVLKKMTEGEGKPAYPLEKRGTYQLFDPYDSFGLGLNFIGVKYNDKDFRVVNALEQTEVLDELKVVHQMYKDGIINSDAFTATEVNPAGMICGVGQGWPMAAETVWGPQRGCEAVVSRFSPTMLSNDSVLGSINSVSVNSQYPDKAIALLELVNSDPYVRDLFWYGEEGSNFEYQDGKVKKLNTDWKMAGYTQGTFFIVTPEVGVEKNQWDEVRELNANAEPSVLLGFQLDRKPIENEIATVTQVWESYAPELMTGAKDPEAAAKEITEMLNAAGMQTIIDECQKQIDAFMASK